MTKSDNERKKTASVTAFGVCVIVIVASAILSSSFQSNFGSIDVQTLRFTDRNGVPLVGKLYRPITANATNPAPGVLALHGFNNDKNVMRPAAIELAKAGIVVLALDQEGDGDSGGFYANDSAFVAGSYQDAFKYLQSLAFVNASDCGLIGHSLGSIRAYFVALFNPAHKAIVQMAFAPSLGGLVDDNNTGIHNLLRITDSWEEFGLNANTTQAEWYNTGEATIRAITGDPLATWNTNYGAFATNTGRRWAFIDGSTHPQLTIDSRSIAEIVAWMLQSLKNMSYTDAWAMADPAKQTYLMSESFGLLALLATLLSILPLGLILMRTKPFEVLKQPRSQKVSWKRGQWWGWASCATAIGGVTYVFFTSFYTNIGGLPFGTDPLVPSNPLITPITGIAVATGFMGWFLINAGIGALFVMIWYLLVRRKSRDAITPVDLGGAIIQKSKGTESSVSPGDTTTAPKVMLPTDRKFKWSYLARTVVLAFILYAWMYLLSLLAGWALNIEITGVWTMMKPFTPARAASFWVYLWPVLVFFLVSGGIYLFGEMKLPDEKSGAKTQMVWWLKYCYVLLFGLIVVMLIQYAPMWFGFGPTLNGAYDANAISPLMPIQLMSFIPFAALLIFQMVFFYRHTGRIYLGAIIVSVTAVWFEMVGLVVYF